jgi:transposase-like protein
MGTSKRIHQMTIPQWEKAFPTDEACMTYLVAHRWPKGVYCPRCGATEPYELPSRPFHWQCTACAPGGSTGYRFSVLVGTVFENTNVGLRMWFRVIHRMLTSKKGVSAHQIYREMGFGSYRTALYMTHRIRAGLAKEEFRKLIALLKSTRRSSAAKPRTGIRMTASTEPKERAAPVKPLSRERFSAKAT